MKAFTDEKKRKKRQKQRTKKRLEKNKANIITNNNLINLYYNDIIKYKEFKSRNNLIKEKLINLIKNKEKYYRSFIKSNFKKFYYNGIISCIIEEKNENMQREKTKKLNNLKKTIISIENRANNYFIKKHKNCFNKWKLISKFLTMKAFTDEKKRKKRQKQRTKKRLEKNKSANKYLSNSNNSISNIHNEKINTNIFREKDKEINYLEHSVTTEFSGMEISIDNRTDKIMRATDKLKGIFYKAALFYKLLENKNNISKDGNAENINNRNIGKNNNEKQNVKDDNRNDDEDDEDSGESSFGI
jgi:hypothetical protein